MNSLHRWIWTVTVAAAGLFLLAVSPSWAGQHPDGQRQERASQTAMPPVGLGDGIMMRHDDAMARRSATDDRIEALVADMHMFTGEFKVVAMEALLTAIVERQSAMMDEMRRMHGAIMPHSVPDASPVWQDEEGSWLDEEPGRMCAPVF
jgi:hypothetical protein